MAYDKLIDSAKLDAAMNATADAIRGKTGGTADIPWNESTGFASAIAAIANGGGKVATGECWPPQTQESKTVSGLGFTPTFVLLYGPLYDKAEMDDAPIITEYKDGETLTMYSRYVGGYYDEEEEIDYDGRVDFQTMNSEWYEIIPTSDGFQIVDHFNDDDYYNQALVPWGWAYFIAIG